MLAAGLLLTVLAAWKTGSTIRSEARERFRVHADRVLDEIAQHMQQAVDGLNGLHALSRVVPIWTRSDFRTYVSTLDLARDFPGVRGFGFIEQVRRNDLAGFIARERADSAPDFTVHSSAGEGDLLVITYVEPAQGHERVQGLDIASDPLRREVAERAIATGRVSLSAPLPLLHHGAKEPGWLFVMPLYSEHGEGATPARKLRGLLFAALSIDDLLTHVQREFDNDVRFRVHDAQAASGQPLFDNQPAGALGPDRSGASDALFEESRTLAIAGRTFEVHVSSTPQLEAGGGRMEAELVMLAGTATTLLLAATLLRLSRGRETAEVASRERERLIRLMIENIPARLSYFDRQLRCRMVNRALTAVFSTPSDQVLGKRLDELLPAEKWQLLEPRVQAALAGEQQEFEWSTASASGAPATMLFYCVPDVRSGEVEGVLLASIDITDLKAAQNEAMRASQAKSQFLSNMSHEIRTPMNAVLGMLSLLRMTPLNERQGDYARKAESAARSLLGLLNDILDVSRIESGKMSLDPQPFFLPSLIDDLELILAATIGEKPVALRVELDPALPHHLVADDMRLRQILINLGGNAIKFTHAGEVTLSFTLAAQAGDRVLMQVVVSDTGIGISPEDQARIFTEFSQASASTTRSFGGSGLGLTICSRLLVLMASELKVDSTPGRGSRFAFKLWMPIAEEAPAASRPAPLPLAKPVRGVQPLRGLRLLVAEDNFINQQVAREVLSSAGAEVQIAGNGQEAVHAIAGQQRFDAVLMDIQMPVMDGFAATREIREGLGETRLPIIAMTANAMESDREQSRAAGMVDHVGKPFFPEELIDTLLRHIGHAATAGEAAPASLPKATVDEGEALLVDRDGAIVRMRDEALYRQLVPTFLGDLRHTLAELREIRAMSRDDATRMLHTLKCTAATMGASQLSEAAGAAERLSKERAELDEARLQSLAHLIQGTLLAFERDAKSSSSL